MGFKVLNWVNLQADFDNPEQTIERAKNSIEHKKLLEEIDKMTKEYYDSLKEETQSIK
jgi:hypothetical protein